MNANSLWDDKSVLVLGCGNVLYGDDGFGPAVAEHLRAHYALPEHALVIDAGLSARDILFDVALGERVPARIVVVDCLDCGRTPGHVFELALDDMPANKTDDFSVHQVPSSNLLKELRDLRAIDVRVCAAQAERIPDHVKPGLTRTMKKAVAHASRMIYETYLKRGDHGENAGDDRH